MEGWKPRSAAAAFLIGDLAEDLVLVDAGCSGGIDEAFRQFGDHLTAYAFDASIGEVQRLQGLETHPKVQYFAAFLGLPAGHPLRQLGQDRSYWRRNPSNGLAPWLALADDPATAPVPSPIIDATLLESQPRPALAVGANVNAYVTDASALFQTREKGDADELELIRTNQWHRTALADPDRPVALDDALDVLKVSDVDVLKIDVDGPDYEILRTVDHRFEAWRTLAVGLEVNFFGSDEDDHNTFHNTDRLMRARGFTLFGLQMRHYASAALPLPFKRGIAAESVAGRPLQADALYMRDFQIRTVGTRAEDYSDDKLIKLAALFALAGLPDMAAEVVLRFEARLAARGVPVREALDRLAAEAQPGRRAPWTYDQYMAAFRAADPWFYGPDAARVDRPVDGAVVDLAVLGKAKAGEGPRPIGVAANTGRTPWDFVAYVGPLDPAAGMRWAEVSLVGVSEPLFLLWTDEAFNPVGARIEVDGFTSALAVRLPVAPGGRWIVVQAGAAPAGSAFVVADIRLQS